VANFKLLAFYSRRQSSSTLCWSTGDRVPRSTTERCEEHGIEIFTKKIRQFLEI